jgi:hypothetical protein
MLAYAGFGVLLVTVAAGEWLGLVIAAAPFVWIWWMRIRTTTAPAVLLLGTSTPTSIARQRDVKRRISPLRVVSLLDVDAPRAWDPALASEMGLDCFRTANDDDWWPVIVRLLEITPVIAIDSAAQTAGVLREVAYILRSGVRRKCIFLTPPDGSAPALDCLLPVEGVERNALRFARYEDGPRVIANTIARLASREPAVNPA